MQRYSNNVQSRTGAALSGVSILVTQAGTPSTLYSDNGVTPLSNPVTSNSDGEFYFYAANGVYDLAVNGSAETTVLLFDVADYTGPLAGNAATATKLATPRAINGVPFDGSQDITIPTGGSWTRKTANYTVVSGDKIFADTTGGAFALTLPALPSEGASATFKSGPAAATNTLTINRNGSTIMGLSENMTVTTNNIEFTLVYGGGTWRL